VSRELREQLVQRARKALLVRLEPRVFKELLVQQGQQVQPGRREPLVQLVFKEPRVPRAYKEQLELPVQRV
jgi:hypothetical protein